MPSPMPPAEERLDRERVAALLREQFPPLSAHPLTRLANGWDNALIPANLLVHGARISAVLDFGDVTSGDPATDLAVSWMLLPPAARTLFWEAYAAGAGHPVDDDLQRRTQGWAVAFAAVFLAHSADNPLMEAVGRATADAVLDAG